MFRTFGKIQCTSYLAWDFDGPLIAVDVIACQGTAYVSWWQHFDRDLFQVTRRMGFKNEGAETATGQVTEHRITLKFQSFDHLMSPATFVTSLATKFVVEANYRS
jgi:hypothetical protein